MEAKLLVSNWKNNIKTGDKIIAGSFVTSGMKSGGFEIEGVGMFSVPEESMNVRFPISWTVVAIKGECVELLCDWCIDWEGFYVNSWEKSAIRDTLNGFIYHWAFTEEERAHICLTKVVTQLDSEKEETEDYLFIPSLEELKVIFPDNDKDKMASILPMYDGTDETELNPQSQIFEEEVKWWLRTSGEDEDCRTFMVVNEDGEVDRDGYSINCDELGVRPIMWVK